MKLFILECTESELKANRGIMDGIVDGMQRFMDAFYGTHDPGCSNNDDDDVEDENDV